MFVLTGSHPDEWFLVLTTDPRILVRFESIPIRMELVDSRASLALVLWMCDQISRQYIFWQLCLGIDLLHPWWNMVSTPTTTKSSSHPSMPDLRYNLQIHWHVNTYMHVLFWLCKGWRLLSTNFKLQISRICGTPSQLQGEMTWAVHRVSYVLVVVSDKLL